MHDKEITMYLANVLYVAHQDGRLTSQELAALDEVRRLVGARRTHLVEATRLVQESRFVPAGVGTFGAHVRNLEDMVFVGLADADLVEGERLAIEGFCDRIGLTQAQLDQIVREAQVRCSDLELRAYHTLPDGAENRIEPHDSTKGAVSAGSDASHPKQTAIARRACHAMIEDCRSAGIKNVELLPSNRDGENCSMALSMRGTLLDINQLPELPLPYCTARRCQCVWVAAG